MSDNFFDKSILNTINTTEVDSNLDVSKLSYNFKTSETGLDFFIQVDEQRLNQSELNSLVSRNENENFLSSDDVYIFNYLSNKLGSIQTIYKIMTDVDIFFKHLITSKIPIFFDENQISITNDVQKLNIELVFDEDSNITIDIKDDSRIIFGSNNVYTLTLNTIKILNEKLPVKFYKEIFSGNNKFRIEDFLNLKDTLIKSLQEFHNVTISQEVEDLVNLNIEEKVAPVVIEIDKTSHFISVELKYKVGNELYHVSNYKYAETSSWVDRDMLIKIVRSDTNLIKYTSDLNISEFTLDDIFMNSKIKYNLNSKNPFQVMLPSSTLESFTTRVLPSLEQDFEIVYKGGKTLDLYNEKVNFLVETNLRTRLNLFEFKVKFKIRDEYFDLDFLKNLMLQNKKYVQLSDGSTANIENIREINKWIEFLTKFEFKKNGNLYRTRTSVALELDEFLANVEGKEIRSNEEYRNLIQELKDRQPIEEISMPDSVDSILRDYQKEGVYWLHFLEKYGFGGILADEMGLGKTIQALTILAMNSDRTHLVVCPKSLIYNWESEIKKYFPGQRILVIDKDSDRRRELIKECTNHNIVITSYSMLQKDFSEYIDNNVNFQYMILDEAHYVKNIKTLSSKAVRVINSDRKVLLTGTPLENNLDELFGTFELVMPGYLGSKADFRRDYVAKIERNNTIALEILQARIRPFILRRTKSQVLKELPDKQEQIVYNEMTNKQVAVYNEVLNRVKMDVEQLVKEVGFDRARIQVLSALLKLRQICNHPSLLDKSFVDETEISGKYEQFLELLDEVVEGGEKVLVFSQFTSQLDIFEKDLIRKKIEYVRLDGSTKDRQKVVDDFNNDEKVRVFLISLKAGGVGLNLTAASAVFLYDPWWNPMAEQQAIDRAHRIGQKKNVNIYKFITKNSIEEKILKLQETKGNLFENLVVEDAGFIKKLEWEDLMELFE